MRVVIYAALSLPFSPATLRQRALGGSESALFYLTREMGRAGVDVTILNHCGEAAGVYDGVRYVDLDREGRWRAYLARVPDIMILFRQTTDLFKALPGRVRVLWAHDHIGAFPERQDAAGRLTALGWRIIRAPFTARVDVVATVSHWLARSFHDHWGLPWERLFVTRNGIDLTAYEALPASRHPARLVYTSVPERGLDLLLRRIFPAIRAQVPNAELHVFSYRDIARYAREAPEGVRVRGSLPQRDLAAELGRSTLHVYPTDFPETSCIAALEAQAAGLPVITSKRYALQETVVDGETGVLVDGAVGSGAYVARFVEAAVQLLRDPSRRAAMGEAARARIFRRYSWTRVAAEWREFLEAQAASAPVAAPAAGPRSDTQTRDAGEAAWGEDSGSTGGARRGREAHR